MSGNPSRTSFPKNKKCDKCGGKCDGTLLEHHVILCPICFDKWAEYYKGYCRLDIEWKKLVNLFIKGEKPNAEPISTDDEHAKEGRVASAESGTVEPVLKNPPRPVRDNRRGGYKRGYARRVRNTSNFWVKRVIQDTEESEGDPIKGLALLRELLRGPRVEESEGEEGR